MSSRREFLGEAAAGFIAAAGTLAAQNDNTTHAGLNFPLVDYHVHLNATFSLDDAIARSKERGVKFGIAEHAGTKENIYPSILSNDEELQKWIARLDGKPVYKGVQAEWLDWAKCFSKDVFAQLDYVLSDAMTFPGRDGKRMKMWEPEFDPGDAHEFIERYVKWSVEVIEKEPLDIFSHPTWLPAPVDKLYDTLWTPERMKPIIEALKRTGTAVEIDSAYNIPGLPFLQLAKEAKLKFSFGSNSGAGAVRTIDFCIERARVIGLTANNMFVPAPRGRKPIQRRRIVA
jgi:histidinol phosphatase-like PHP family hydrolase